MNNWAKRLLEWAQTKGKHIPNGIKGVIDKLKTPSTLSVNNLASFIMLHPDTKRKQDEWLGLIFHSYRLQIEKVSFYLETKGKNNYILLCQVADENGIVSQFTSYDEGTSVDDQMKVPF
jgi:hypothetical protein